MEWNINTGYDPGDETVNFGTRAFAESDGCIYEITTVATFESEKEVSGVPSLNFGHISTGAQCVCVGNTLTLFSDQSCSDVLVTTAFDSKIETYTCSVDGNFLLVGLCNGFIHCLHIPSEGEPVYAKNLKTKPYNGHMFAKIIVDDEYPEDVLVVCASGIVFNVSNFSFSAIHSALSRENSPDISSVTSNITVSALCEMTSVAPVHSATTLKVNDEAIILAVGRGFATIPFKTTVVDDSEDQKWMECASTNTLLRVEFTKNKRLFIALNSEGQLICLCPFTHLMIDLPLLKQPLSDFQLAGTDVLDASIIGITAQSPERESYLTIMSYSDLCEKFSLPIGFPSILPCTPNDLEDIRFLECLKDKVSSQVSGVALKVASQTVPRFRLERLLARKKFEAAEALVRNFGLDMSFVHKAKAKDILEQMQPWSHNIDSKNEESTKLLINELDNISDLDFVCNHCVNAVPPDYSVAHTLLDYAQQRLELYFVNNPELESKFAELSSIVCGSLLRLETYDLIKPKWDWEEWLKFSHADLILEVHSWVNKGGLSQAAIIWSRHKNSFKSSLKDKNIVKYLLEDIPSTVSLDEILDWLAHLLPPLLDVQLATLPSIVSWIHEKICGLERSHPREWPKIGLDYAERTLKLFSSQKVASPFLGLEVSPLRPLVTLRCALSDLHSLWSKYYLTISLEEFLQGPEDVAILLVDCIDVSSISPFVTGYLNGFMLDHKLDADGIISKYIMCILKNSVGWWHWEEAPWELRISSLIPHITNYKIRLECIVATLNDAPVPWSPLMSSLAEDGLKLKHPFTSRIREKQKQVATNLILKKYNLKTHMDKIDKKVLLSYILKQNHPDMLHDISQLSQNCVDDYVTVVWQLFHLGNTSKCIEVLRSLPDEMVLQICPRIIARLSSALDYDENCDVEGSLELLSAVAFCHDTAVPSKFHSDLNDPLNRIPLEELKNRFYLKRDFGIRLNKDEMSNLKSRKDGLREGIQELLMEVVEEEKPEEKPRRLYQRLLHLSRLLMIPVSAALLELIEQSLALSNFSLAADMAEYFDDLSGLPEEIYKRLSSLPSQLLSRFKISGGNAEVVRKAAGVAYSVASKVCSHSDSGDILDIVVSSGWAKVWRNVSGKQEVSSIGQRDVLLTWRFSPLYKDPGLVGFLNGSPLVELLHKAYMLFNKPEDLNSNPAVIEQLVCHVAKLQSDHHDVAVFTILARLANIILFHHNLAFLRNSRNSSLSEVSKLSPALEDLLIKTSKVLLTKVAASRQFDKYIGLGLVATIGLSKALKYLQEMCNSKHADFQKQSAFACLGVLSSEMWKLQDEFAYFKKISVQSSWASRLPELGLSAKELLRESSDCEMVLPKLLGSKSVTSSILRSYCADYSLDFQKVLVEHLRCILLTWEPNPKVTINSDGTKDIVEQNTQQQLLEKCWELQKDIKDKSLLCQTLVNIWEKINFYHHEVFIVVLEILERHGISNENNKRLITTFLKSYRRIKAPDQTEEEFWAQVFPSSFGLPIMAEFRLPFHRRLIEKPMAVVRSEINLNTYKSWLSIAAALDLSKDKICTIAVHHTVTEEFSSCQSSGEWCGTLKNEALFESVAECVSVMDDVEQAAATLYFFMNKIPPGLDQVDAANLCLQYAEEVFKITHETDYKLKVEKKYFHLATLQSLHQYGLGQPCYLKLVHNPTELIHALYQHPSILELCRGIASFSLDINAAVQQISRLHGICLKTVHLNLVTEWLQPDVILDFNASLDDDYFDGSSALKRESQNQNYPDSLAWADDNILRARYIMEHGDVQEWALFLLSTVFEEKVCVGMRLRAIQCLCMLTDDETLEELSARSVSSIRNTMRSLGYMRDLEILGLTYSESSFESCDKKELANLILQTHTFHPRAISLLVRLCVDFNINDLSLWNAMLQQLVELALMKELELALSHTSDMYHLWNLPIFRKAWTLLLSSPFTKVNCLSEKDQEVAMLHALSLFPSCPVLRQVDVNSALEFSLMINRPDIGALLLPYVENGATSVWKEKILSLTKSSEILEKITKMCVGKCINVSKVMNLFAVESSKVNGH